MLMYAVGVLLMHDLSFEGFEAAQAEWYTDNLACCGSLWLVRLLEHGPAYGYYAEPLKSVLIIK